MRRTLVVSAAANELRDRHYVLDPVTGLYVRTVLLEPTATNLLLRSCDLFSAWGGAADFTVSPAVSIFGGQTAWRHQNLGMANSRSRTQAIGTFSGQAETASVIVENVNAAWTDLWIRDTTAGAHVCVGRLDWATGQASVQQGAGTVRAIKLADAGPNGGPVYRLMVTGTGPAGNQRSVALYPTGIPTNTQAAIIHHVQHEVGAVATSPIVTTTAAVTRSADVLTFPWLHPPQAMTGYLRFIELGAVADNTTRVLMQIGTGAGGVMRRLVVHNPGTMRYAIQHNADATTVASTLPVSPVPAVGDLVELLWRLYNDGSVQIEMAINGGAPIVAQRSGSAGLAPGWSDTSLGLSSRPGGAAAAPAAWLGWAIELGSSDATWDYMRAAVGW